MNKQPTGKEYMALLGEALSEILPDGFQKLDSANPRYARRQSGRTEEVGVRLRTKFWPHGNIDLTFGISYDEFQPVFNDVVNEYNLDIPHIHHDTMNIHQMEGLYYLPRIIFTKLPIFWKYMNLGNWPCHRDESPEKAIRRTKGAIGGVVEPFFKRFSDIREAWSSLRDDDGWSMQGSSYMTVLAFGAFLNDSKGIEEAKRRLICNRNEKGIANVNDYLDRLQAYLRTHPD